MLSNIKSLEIIKKILKPIKKVQILKLVNYNKLFQSKLSIKLDDYKINAKSLRISDKDGKGKEYDIKTNELIFEGEYKNKKRSGLGKEYEEGKLIFEGEYKEGLRNGNGKAYDEKNGNLIFEGKFLNGIEWEGKGMVKELRKNTLLYRETAYIYGEFSEGKINGEGKLITKDRTKYKYDYEGNFVKGKKNGKGKEFYDLESSKILIYEGEYENDKRNGYGKEYKDGKIIFEGKFLDGERWEGYGKEFNHRFNEDKVDFEGEYKNGKRNGKGKEYFNDNIVSLFSDNDFNENTIKYEGNYYDGEREGEGIEYFENGKIKFKGEFTNGKKKNGVGYNPKGEVVYEIKEGEGNIKIYNYKDKIEFQGEYKNYQYWNGKENEYYKDEDTLKSEIFYTGGKISCLKEYDRYDGLIFEAIFENGKIKTGKEYKKGELIFEGEYKPLTIENNNIFAATNLVMSLAFDKMTLKSCLMRWTGKGKEYNKDGELIYEGEIFQGEKYGKGKIYDIKNNLIIEGQFSYGKKNGLFKTYKKGVLLKEIDYSKVEPEGKQYDEQGKVIFEGTFDDDGEKSTGNYKEYYEDGNLKLEGKLNNGDIEGNVKEYYEMEKYYSKENINIGDDIMGNSLIKMEILLMK